MSSNLTTIQGPAINIISEMTLAIPHMTMKTAEALSSKSIHPNNLPYCLQELKK